MAPHLYHHSSLPAACERAAAGLVWPPSFTVYKSPNSHLGLSSSSPNTCRCCICSTRAADAKPESADGALLQMSGASFGRFRAHHCMTALSIARLPKLQHPRLKWCKPTMVTTAPPSLLFSLLLPLTPRFTYLDIDSWSMAGLSADGAPLTKDALACVGRLSSRGFCAPIQCRAPQMQVRQHCVGPTSPEDIQTFLFICSCCPISHTHVHFHTIAHIKAPVILQLRRGWHLCRASRSTSS